MLTTTTAHRTTTLSTSHHPQRMPPAGSHGGDAPLVARALGLDPASMLDLSQTLNPFAAPIDKLISKHLTALREYPDPRSTTDLLAEAIGVDPERVLITNGGSEAIALVAAALGGRPYQEPEFALHPRGRDGPVWRSDPHNPSGHLAGEKVTADVWDEAFFALSTGRWTAGRGGVTIGSLTKTFACPGLRIGYIIADDVHRFATLQPHWSVNSLALAVLPDLIEGADLAGWTRSIAYARAELVDIFEHHGLTVRAADAPWVLVHAPGLREAMAPFGVVVRDCVGFNMPGVYRVAVPNADGMARVQTALDRIDLVS